jgi:hypothetical protein
MMRPWLSVAVLGIGLGSCPLGRAAADGWGTIKGQVVYGDAAIPPRQKIDNKNCPCKDPVLSDDWVVNPKNKGIRWTFVWLAPAPGGAPLAVNPQALERAKKNKVEIDQPKCMFEPHAAAILPEQDILVKNSAEIPHNVKWGGNPLKNPGGNVILPPKGSHVIGGLKADRLPVKVECNIHGWMSGWIRVFDNPYFAVTDEDGNFEIKDAPAGNYRLVIWHESVGYRGGAAGRDGVPMDVKAGGITDAGKFDLKKP